MIAIIGAGISGLSLAWHLERLGKPYRLYEAGADIENVGGLIRSIRRPDGYLLDTGPNSILCSQEIINFLHDLGLEDQMILPKKISKNRYVLRNGRYKALPSNPFGLLLSDFFSFKTKKRIWAERQIKSLSPKHETVKDFFVRRFGNDVFQYAVCPFVSGIFAGDPSRMLMEFAFPALLEMEQKYGSVLRGVMKNSGSAKRKQSYNFVNGMSSLTRKIADSLSNLHLDSKIITIKRNDISGKYSLIIGSSAGLQSEIVADKIVFSLPAYGAAGLLETDFGALATALNQIQYARMAMVHTGLPQAAIVHKLNGFGGLHPACENSYTTGHLWASSTFEHRAPEGKVLIGSFIGGAAAPQKAIESDEIMLSNLNKELETLYQIDASQIEFQHISRWPQAIPQHEASMILLKPLLDDAQTKGIYVCANWWGGISVSDCITKAGQLAQKL